MYLHFISRTAKVKSLIILKPCIYSYENCLQCKACQKQYVSEGETEIFGGIIDRPGLEFLL